MAQAVAEIVPQIRRALEGPKPLAESNPARLSAGEIEALTADAIADIILLTRGEWPHTLIRTVEGENDSWSVDPELTEVEIRVVAAQVSMGYFLFILQDQKTSERIVNEAQEWEYTKSAQAVVRQIDALRDARDAALSGLMATHPVLAQYASFLEVRDKRADMLLEPWRSGFGGQELLSLLP